MIQWFVLSCVSMGLCAPWSYALVPSEWADISQDQHIEPMLVIAFADGTGERAYLPLAHKTEPPTFYVAPDGDDANPGTFDAPWRTINYAAQNTAVVGPGATVYICPGTYRENVNQTVSGAPFAPVVFAPCPGEAAPVISGGSPSAQWVLRDVSHVKISGLSFLNYACGGLHVLASAVDVTDVQIEGNTFQGQVVNDACNTFRHVIIAGTLNSDVAMTNVRIEGNTITDVATGTPFSYDETVTFFGNVSSSGILENRLTDVSYIGINLIGRHNPNDFDYGQPYDIVIRGNHIDGVRPTNILGVGPQPGIGIYTDGPKRDILIEENVVENATGIFVNSEPSAWALGTRMEMPTRVLVRRNIVNVSEGSGSYGLALGIGALNITDCYAELSGSAAVHNTIYVAHGEPFVNLLLCGRDLVWKNNIFVSLGSPTARLQGMRIGASESDWRLDGNLYYYGASQAAFQWPTCPDAHCDSLEAFQIVSGQDAASLHLEPLLAAPETGNFQPTEHSPAVDSALPLAYATNSGQGSTVLSVDDARFFVDGYGVQSGDRIRIGDGQRAVRATVIAVDAERSMLFLDHPVAWNESDAITYDYDGTNADIGAVESVNP